MKKKSISKKFIGVVIAIVMLFSFVPTMAVNAANVPRMEADIRSSMFSNTMVMADRDGSRTVMTTGVYILQSNGELWAYIAGNPNNPTGIVSGLVMTDIVAFVSNFSLGSVVNNISDAIYYSNLSGLALRADGTVWLCTIGIYRNSYEIYINTVQIGSDIVKISGSNFLRANGDLYTIYNRRQAGLITYLESPQIFDIGRANIYVAPVARNIIDTNAGRHLPSNRILEIDGVNFSNVQELFSGAMANFILTSDGRLYGSGNNTRGSVGVGLVADRVAGVSGSWTVSVVRPRHIMNDVVSIYFDDSIVFARDRSGRLWTWGGAESATVGAGNAVVWPSEQKYFTPRLSEHNEPVFNIINGIAIRADGTLWVQCIDQTDYNNQITHDIMLPVRFNQIMGNSGTPTSPQPPTTETPSSWAIPQVNAAIAAGLVPQNLQSRYTQATTRAEFAALAVALYETVTGRVITGRTQFNDTNDINVQKMGYLGVVTGVGGGNFAPNNTLTREQAAVMLARLANAIGQPLPQSAPTFADNNQISSWAIDAVGQIQAAGIMGGVGNNQFAPNGDYTREQSIVTMMRLFDILN